MGICLWVGMFRFAFNATCNAWNLGAFRACNIVTILCFQVITFIQFTCRFYGIWCKNQCSCFENIPLWLNSTGNSILHLLCTFIQFDERFFLPFEFQRKIWNSFLITFQFVQHTNFCWPLNIPFVAFGAHNCTFSLKLFRAKIYSCKTILWQCWSVLMIVGMHHDKLCKCLRLRF